MTGDSYHVVARVSFDPYGDPYADAGTITGPTWYCEVGSEDAESVIQGVGVDPLGAALAAAELATAAHMAACYPAAGSPVVMTPKGRRYVDASGSYGPDPWTPPPLVEIGGVVMTQAQFNAASAYLLNPARTTP